MRRTIPLGTSINRSLSPTGRVHSQSMRLIIENPQRSVPLFTGVTFMSWLPLLWVLGWRECMHADTGRLPMCLMKISMKLIVQYTVQYIAHNTEAYNYIRSSDFQCTRWWWCAEYGNYRWQKILRVYILWSALVKYCGIDKSEFTSNNHNKGHCVKGLNQDFGSVKFIKQQRAWRPLTCCILDNIVKYAQNLLTFKSTNEITNS